MKKDLLYIFLSFIAVVFAFEYDFVMHTFAGLGVFAGWWWMCHKQVWKELML